MDSSNLIEVWPESLPLWIAKTHPLLVGAVAVGAVGALAVYKRTQIPGETNNLNGPPASSFLWGHAPEMFDPASSIPLQDRLLHTYGTACRMKGELGGDQLWIADPRAMQEILVKGHDDFKVPDSFVTWMKLVWGPTSMTATGHRHKLHRKILNPVFATKYIRECEFTDKRRMIQTPVMSSIAHQLEYIVKSKVRAGGGTTGIVDIYKWMNYIAFEIIGQAGMGCSFGVMEDKVPEYLSASRDMFRFILEMWYMRPFLPLLIKIGPASFRRAVVERIPNSSVQGLKKVVDIMDVTAADIIRRRSEGLEHANPDLEVVAGEDLMTTLLRHNQEVIPEEQLTHAEILAAVNGLVFGGHDTTSSALARTLHLLSSRQNIQDKLRTEFREAHERHGQDLDFEQLNSLTYLDAICREVLRLYPPEAFVEREATRDWVLPLQYPVKSRDGNVVASVGVKKGTHIYVSLVAANRDKQTWGEDAEVFRPERWLEPLPTTVGKSNMPGVFSSTMTFLGGPRACPGMRFSQLEMKVVLSTLISSFKFDLAEGEITWRNDVIVKPYTRGRDGTISPVPSMPMRVTLVAGSD